MSAQQYVVQAPSYALHDHHPIWYTCYRGTREECEGWLKYRPVDTSQMRIVPEGHRPRLPGRDDEGAC